MYQIIQRNIPFKSGVQANDGVGLLLQLLGQTGQQLAGQNTCMACSGV